MSLGDCLDFGAVEDAGRTDRPDSWWTWGDVPGNLLRVSEKRSVRRPSAADAHALASVHVRAWRAAYRGLMPDEVLDGLSVEEGARGWLARIEQSHGPGLLVGTLDETVAGFAVSGPARDEDAEGVGELYAINLDPDAWGLGLGRMLFRRACEDLNSMGFQDQVLWVAEANARARGLYDSEGWFPDGGTKTDEAHGSVREVRYRRLGR